MVMSLTLPHPYSSRIGREDHGLIHRSKIEKYFWKKMQFTWPGLQQSEISGPRGRRLRLASPLASLRVCITTALIRHMQAREEGYTTTVSGHS